MSAETETKGCGDQVVTRDGIGTCDDHTPGFGHYDTRLRLSWPEGDGRFVTVAEAAS